MKLSRVWPVLLVLFVSAQVRAATPDRGRFLFVKELAPPAERASTLGVVPVDEEVLAATDNGYANLRVLTPEQTEVPFLVRPRRVQGVQIREVEVPMTTVSLHTRADNAIEILLHRGRESVAPSVLQFETQAHNFEKNISIEGSVDGVTWRMLADAKPIFDYTRFLDVRNTRVEFAAGPCTQFRVIVSNIMERAQSPMVQIARDTRNGVLVSEVENTSFMRGDFRVDCIRAFARKPTATRAEVVMRDYALSSLAITNDAREKITVATFRAMRAPLTEFTLLADDSNFCRACTLEATDAESAGHTWVSLGDFRFMRVRAGQFLLEEMRLTPGTTCRYRRYRLTIHNQDSPPLRITGLTARGEIHELVFFADCAHACRLLYGGDGIPSPQYDIGAVLQNAETANMDAYRAGGQKANPEFRTPHENKRFKCDGRMLMTGAIILMVAVLAWVIVVAARRLDPPAGS